MPEQVSGDDAGKKSDPEIAAADLLFRDDPKEKPARPEATPAARGRVGRGIRSGAGARTRAGVLVGTRPGTDSDRSGGSPRPKPADRPRETRAARSEATSPEDPGDLVEEVWSRQGEWGPTLSCWPAGCS